MSTSTRRIGTAAVAGLLALVGAAGCGGAETPATAPTSPSAPSTTATPTPAPSPTPEPGLTGPTVVVVRELSDDSRVLVAYDLDGGTTRELTTLESTDNSPTVDADGTSVVVVRYPVPPNEPEPAQADHRVTSHLVLIDLSTGERRALTVRKDGVAAEYPQWNRAGDGWVYFQRSDYTAHTAGLWRVDPRTGEAEEVLNGAAVAWGGFALEPGGDSIWVGFEPCSFDNAFTCGEPDEAGAPTQFTRLDLNTGSISVHPFGNDGSGRIGSVAWTPDGAWLAYTRNSCGYPACPELVITSWPDGTPRSLLKMPEGAALFAHVGWHPDDSTVVLQSDSILLVDAADGSTTPIGPASVNDLSFDVWAPPAD